jgi:hypothetical protein
MRVVFVMLLWLVATGADSSKEYRDYYKFFEPGSPPSRLRRRFRQLALDFHPDHQRAGTDKAAAQRKYLLLTTAFEKLLARSRSEDPHEEARTRATRASAEERLRADARRKSEERARETEMRQRAAEASAKKAREEEEKREMEREMLALDEERAAMSRMLEFLFLVMLSVATVLGVGVSYYFFALRDEVLLIDQRRAAEAVATEREAIPERQEAVFSAVAEPVDMPVRANVTTAAPVDVVSIVASFPPVVVDVASRNAEDDTQMETRESTSPPSLVLTRHLPPPVIITHPVTAAKRKPGIAKRTTTVKKRRPKRDREAEEKLLPERELEKKPKT